MSATKVRKQKNLTVPVVGRWHWVLKLHPHWARRDAMIFSAGIFKLHSVPPPGEMITRKHYKGFFFNWDIGLPVWMFAWNPPTINQMLGLEEKDKTFFIGTDFGSPDGDHSVVMSKDSEGNIQVEESEHTPPKK